MPTFILRTDSVGCDHQLLALNWAHTHVIMSFHGQLPGKDQDNNLRKQHQNNQTPMQTNLALQFLFPANSNVMLGINLLAISRFDGCVFIVKINPPQKTPNREIACKTRDQHRVRHIPDEPTKYHFWWGKAYPR